VTHQRLIKTYRAAPCAAALHHISCNSSSRVHFLFSPSLVSPRKRKGRPCSRLCVRCRFCRLSHLFVPVAQGSAVIHSKERAVAKVLLIVIPIGRASEDTQKGGWQRRQSWKTRMEMSAQCSRAKEDWARVIYSFAALWGLSLLIVVFSG
jgi:hypothetical protein